MDIQKIYDMVILGGGPGGYTAALYAARAGLSVVVLEKLSPGGQMAQTQQVDNYPGFEDGIDGFALAEKMQKQAERFGAVTEYAEATNVDLTSVPKKIATSEGTFYGKTVVIATGAEPRELGIPEEHALIGRGVAYCASCDGMFYKGKTVVVVGGGNSAVEDALLLSRIAANVILVHRRDTLRAEKLYQDQLKAQKNVKFKWNCVITEFLYKDKITGIRIQNTVTKDTSEQACDAVFISVGRKPSTALVSGQITLNSDGYIIAGETTRTNIPGVFAVGDVRTKLFRQVITAAGDGAVAARMAEEFLFANEQ